jgi:serine/threonine protein kinase
MTDEQGRIGQSVGDYRLLRLLGKGRFGSVYLAEHVYEHTSTAVKVLHMPLTGPNDFDVFLKEARTVRLLHPHIVSLFDFDLSRDGLPYLAMTYAGGGSLRERYPQGSKLSPVTIDTYVQQLASALQYAHDCHVIHHDVKPENMLMSSDGKVQLSDLSIARVSGQASLCTQPKVLGTPAYTAPEQCQGHPCPASDQYALAVVVYEWLTGQRPFQGDPFAIASQHQADTPPSLCDINPEVPPLVEGVILKALAKAPKDRYPTITYFAEALHIALQEDEEPTQIHPRTTLVELSPSGEEESGCELSPIPQFVGESCAKLDISQYETAPVTPVNSADAPPPAPADTSFPPQLVLASPPNVGTPDRNELHNAPTIGYHQNSSTLAKDRLRKMIQQRSLARGPVPLSQRLKLMTQRQSGNAGLAPLSQRLKTMTQHQSGNAGLAPRLRMLVDGGLAPLSQRLKTTIQRRLGDGRLAPRLRRLVDGGLAPLSQRLKLMIQHQSVNGGFSPLAQRLHSQPAWMRIIGSFLIVLFIGGGFAAFLHILPTQSASPTQKSGVTPIAHVSTQHQVQTPRPSPHPQTPTPTPSPQHPTPTPTPPPVISAAIPAGELLYSTRTPFSACDKQGGHWTDTSDARVTCNSDGSEIVNTSGHLAIANLDQLVGNQSPWSCQSCIVQVQATVNPNSQGAFGIDFQTDGTQEYFAYVLNPPDNWAFNYYNISGGFTNTLIASQFLSSVSRQLTIDIRVEGTFYKFYVNGVDTTGRAITGSQYSNKIVGLAVGTNADITFSNLAIFAL